MKTLLTAAAVVALFAGSASATDLAFGGGSGVVSSTSISGGIAATGGLAAGNNNGFSSVHNFQGAANTSGVTGLMKFTEIDRNGLVRDVDGIAVQMEFDTFSVSEQLSETRVRDRGTGTAGLGGGVAISGGAAHGEGSFGFFGLENW